MKKEKKIIFALLGLILILASVITYGLLTSRDFQAEIDGLQLEISERDAKIEFIETVNVELTAVDEIQKEENVVLKKEIDSILEISYEIHNPKSDPVPTNLARNDSIRKWSKPFQ